MNNAIFIKSMVANSSGIAVLNLTSHPNFSGVTLHIQAYAELASTCGITNRVTQTVQ